MTAGMCYNNGHFDGFWKPENKEETENLHYRRNNHSSLTSVPMVKYDSEYLIISADFTNSWKTNIRFI